MPALKVKNPYLFSCYKWTIFMVDFRSIEVPVKAVPSRLIFLFLLLMSSPVVSMRPLLMEIFKVLNHSTPKATMVHFLLLFVMIVLFVVMLLRKKCSLLDTFLCGFVLILVKFQSGLSLLFISVSILVITLETPSKVSSECMKRIVVSLTLAIPSS